MKRHISIGLLALSIPVFILTACGESSQIGEQAAKARVNPLEPRYKATLAEGITFRNPGYPEFVKSIKGISVQEGFGRWTDDIEAAIEFTQPLPKKFTLKITATSYAPSMGESVKFVIGGKKYQAEFPAQWDFKEIAIPIVTDGQANLITVELPNAKVPLLIGQGQDGRKLSLALSSIKIIE